MVDESPLMSKRRESVPALEQAEVGGSAVPYPDADDVAGLYEDLESAGVDRNAPQETDFGWQQFAVTDPNGYVLWFGERLEVDRTEDSGRRHRTYHDNLTHEGQGRGLVATSFPRRASANTGDDVRVARESSGSSRCRDSRVGFCSL
jgi:hypothetical protein